ncbi:MAG: DUF2304 family protein [Patescibacteria group bacterium]
MFIKYFLILLIVLIISRVVLRWREKSLNTREFVFWLLFWLAAGAVALQPDWTGIIAERLGIGRGADLVVYLSLVAIFYLLFRIQIQQKKTEREITKIVRKIALKDE